MTGVSRLRGVLQPAAWAAVLLIAAGCTGSSASGTPMSAVPAASVPTILPTGGTAVGVRDFSLDPQTVRVVGPDVVLDVKNGGPTVHNITIRDASGTVLGFTPDLREGDTATLTASLRSGTYVLFCSLPGHESLGIKGTLTVSAP